MPGNIYWSWTLYTCNQNVKYRTLTQTINSIPSLKSTFLCDNAEQLRKFTLVRLGFGMTAKPAGQMLV